MKEFHIFDVQASEPRTVTRPDGSTYQQQPGYANVRAFVLARTVQSATAAFVDEHPDATLHQIIKRNGASSSEVIIERGLNLYPEGDPT